MGIKLRTNSDDTAISYKTFARRYRQRVNPNASEETIRKSYDGFSREIQTINTGKHIITRAQFRKLIHNLNKNQLDDLFEIFRSQIQGSKNVYENRNRLNEIKTREMSYYSNYDENIAELPVNNENEMNYRESINYEKSDRMGGSAVYLDSVEQTKKKNTGTVRCITTVNFEDRSEVLERLVIEEENIGELDYEVNCSITRDGRVWKVEGEREGVHPELIPYSLEGSYSYHNHPSGETWYSFSAEDAAFFIVSGQKYSKASDDMFEYVMERTLDTLAEEYEIVYNRFKEIQRTEVRELMWNEVIDPDFDEFHEIMKILSREFRFNYVRRKKDGSK